MKYQIIALTVIFLPLLTDCSPTVKENNDIQWIDQKIAQYEAEQIGPYNILECEYKNQITYYIPAWVADGFNYLYNQEGNKLCAPDGGFSGRGDGGCKDFDKERCKTYWSNPYLLLKSPY